MAQAALEAILIRVCGQEKGVELVLDLTQGLEGDTTVEQSQWLWEVARKKRTMEEFLDRFGHRAVEEMELARPRWREDDSYVLHLVGACSDESVTAPASMHDRNAEQRVKTEEELPAILAQFGASSLLGEIKAEMLDAQALLPYRESGKFHLMMGYETIRVAIVELGRRWDIGSGVFFLRKDELAEYESRRDVLNETIKTRRGLWQASKQLHMDDVVDSTALDQLGLQKHYDAASELAAEPIAPGVNTGTARLVSDPTEAADIGTDYVLVCRSTDPGWTGLFVRAKGLVVEQGGILSHGAIVARDFGIPAVVCKDAMSRIPDRALIRVDGNHGRIAILEQPSGGKV
jgi:pyruvate,water dikinase